MAMVILLGGSFVGSPQAADTRSDSDSSSLQKGKNMLRSAYRKLEAGQPQEDLEKINRRNGAETEEAIPRTASAWYSGVAY